MIKYGKPKKIFITILLLLTTVSFASAHGGGWGHGNGHGWGHGHGGGHGWRRGHQHYNNCGNGYRVNNHYYGNQGYYPPVVVTPVQPRAYYGHQRPYYGNQGRLGIFFESGF